MTSKNKLMHASFHTPERYNSCHISPAKIALVTCVLAHRKMTTQKLAKLKKISTANASNRLNTLYKDGWLTRESIGDPTGGNMYEYRCEPAKWGKEND